MAEWRRVYLANVLSSKYGILGRVASRYVLAGFSVRVNNELIHAKGNKSSMVIAVATNGKELISKAKYVKEIASKVSAKPVVVLYGSYKVSKDVIDKVNSEGVAVKFIRC